MENAKSLSKFGLDQFGIQLVKPSANFASKNKRFNDGTNATSLANGGPGVQTQQPGPGHYEVPGEWRASQSKTQGGWSQPQDHQVMQVLPNAPSIPSHNNVFGYEENARGQLVK